MKLVIVESPTKAKTIQKFLGSGYRVQSSFGHIRDLPKSRIGVDTDNNFEPQYVIPTKARKTATALKKEAEKADGVILGTDEDREGEAIAWHLAHILSLKKPERIVFHEITKEAIEAALRSPRTIDLNLVDSQQARRILDRLVGYKLSPFLWRKVLRGLSAGRVQSAALRIVVDREREVEAFVPQEYWSVEAMLQKINNKQSAINEEIFVAQLAKRDGKAIEKLGIKTKEEADAILRDLKDAVYKVADVEQKETKRNPLPPFTTSTLQQDASRKLGFSAKQTMSIAQQLYETGLITYHRTDSMNLSEHALKDAAEVIGRMYGKAYCTTRRFKTTSKGAQEAHEAIRPTGAGNTPDNVQKNLQERHIKLYRLIWQRFLASQMAPARFSATAVDVRATGHSASAYTFRANGQTLLFDGFLKAYPMKFEEATLPALSKEESLALEKLAQEQHFTQPPARYTEAGLVKALEEHGIGRPSTYAPTISTIQTRGYVEKNKERRFVATDLGKKVTDLLLEHFPQIVDVGFTASVEEKFDDIAEGTKEWVPVIREFYEPFEKLLEQKDKEIVKEEVAVEEVPDKMCPKCSSPVVIRTGRFGRFYACSAFPKCKHTEPL
ncbi:MAG: type I DNA topoisomerase, partial [Candidatus Wildermuthbacteria bacterium]|nr:type I DNA topoisomerase [Candidatus Wildermuthbacteria bacterium]